MLPIFFHLEFLKRFQITHFLISGRAERKVVAREGDCVVIKFFHFFADRSLELLTKHLKKDLSNL